MYTVRRTLDCWPTSSQKPTDRQIMTGPVSSLHTVSRPCADCANACAFTTGAMMKNMLVFGLKRMELGFPKYLTACGPTTALGAQRMALTEWSCWAASEPHRSTSCGSNSKPWITLWNAAGGKCPTRGAFQAKVERTTEMVENWTDN